MKEVEFKKFLKEESERGKELLRDAGFEPQ
jgi:hypothetical protein